MDTIDNANLDSVSPLVCVRTGWLRDITRAGWQAWIRMLLIFCMGLAFLLPRYIDYIRSGLDPSWVYVINVSTRSGWIFGEDILFTHGPLGFLSSTCGVGRNIEIVLVVVGIFFVAQMRLLGRFVFSKSVTLRPDMAVMVLSCLLLWIIPRPRFDSYLLYMVLLLLSAAWSSGNPRRYYGWACMLTTLQMFIVFTGALSCSSAIGLYWIIWFFKDRAAWRKIWWMPSLIPIAFVACYLLYNPSWAGLWSYVRSARELTAGYSLSMSLADEPLYVWLTLATGAIYLLVLIASAVKNRSTAQYVLLFAGCFAVAMKHGLVRADMWHLDAALCAAMPMFSLMLLFGKMKWETVLKRWKIYGAACGFALIALCVAPDARGFVREGRAYLQAVYAPNWNRFSSISRVADKITNPLLGSDPLPRPFLEAIGTNTTAFYPLELSLAAFNDVQFRPMPVLQAYTAYTPYLDGWNADFFSEDMTAPAFIVLSLRAVDGRWPLIESPLAWNAIRENYEFFLMDPPFLLLRRKTVPGKNEYTMLSAGECGTMQEITLPEAKGRVFITAEMELNLRGRIARLFYQVPAVNLKAAFTSGLVVDGRCIPENLRSKTLISFLPLPFELEETAAFLRSGHEPDRVKQIALGGPGLAYYRRTMKVTLYEDRILNGAPASNEHVADE